jgi:hypothetical protein
MKTLKLTLCALFCTLLSPAQTLIKGKVLNEENQPIAYANIGFVNSSIGTVSNANGEFSLTIPNEIATSEILRISMMGYGSREFRRDQMSSGEILTIRLVKEDFLLPEVSVMNKETVTKQKGNMSPTSRIKTNLAISSEPNMNLGAAIGRRFHLGKKGTVVKKLHFFIAGNNYDTVLVRIQFYSIKGGKPHSPLHGEQIVREIVQFRKGWVEIDLEAYHLVLIQDVVACVEWIGASQRGNAFYLNMNMPAFGETHYYRFGSQNKWKVFYAMSTSMYLTLEMER